MSAKCHEQTSYASAGSRSRTRDRGGEIRKKRSDTLVRTVREEYGDHFASGYRPNDKLGKVLEKEGWKASTNS